MLHEERQAASRTSNACSEISGNAPGGFFFGGEAVIEVVGNSTGYQPKGLLQQLVAQLVRQLWNAGEEPVLETVERAEMDLMLPPTLSAPNPQCPHAHTHTHTHTKRISGQYVLRGISGGNGLGKGHSKRGRAAVTSTAAASVEDRR